MSGVTRRLGPLQREPAKDLAVVRAPRRGGAGCAPSVRCRARPPRAFLLPPLRECAKDGDLLGAGRPEVLFEQRLRFGVEVAAPAFSITRSRVGARLRDRVRSGSRGRCSTEPRQRADEVGGGSVVLRWTGIPTTGELHRDGRGDGRLPDAALSHDHHQPATGVDPARRRACTGEGDRGRVNGSAKGLRGIPSRPRTTPSERPIPTRLWPLRGTSNRGTASGYLPACVRGRRRLSRLSNARADRVVSASRAWKIGVQRRGC